MAYYVNVFSGLSVSMLLSTFVENKNKTANPDS